MTYTVEQVHEAVRKHEDSIGSDGWRNDNFYDEIMWAGKDKPILLEHLSDDGENAWHVAREGGTEGDGDHMAVVFRIGDQLFEKSGYHNSWDSNDWDNGYGLEEVEEYEKVVKAYRSVKR